MRSVIYIQNLVDEQYATDMDYAMLAYFSTTLQLLIIDAFNDKNENVWFVKTNEIPCL